MAKQIAAGQIDEEMQEAYKTFDTGGKGWIDIDDLSRVIESYNEKLEPAELE